MVPLYEVRPVVWCRTDRQPAMAGSGRVCVHLFICVHFSSSKDDKYIFVVIIFGSRQLHTQKSPYIYTRSTSSHDTFLQHSWFDTGLLHLFFLPTPPHPTPLPTPPTLLPTVLPTPPLPTPLPTPFLTPPVLASPLTTLPLPTQRPSPPCNPWF